jgi:hypothetical protein
MRVSPDGVPPQLPGVGPGRRPGRPLHGPPVTSYDIQGSKNNKLLGYFVSVTWEGIVGETGGNPNFGAHGVTLVE